MATVTKPIALDESINTTEQTPRNIADVLAEELARIAENILPPNAEDIAYDNTESGLTATNVQDAIDEVISSQADVIADTMADLTENKTATVTDGVADFETIDGSLVKSLVVEIEPSQSGSGTPSPDNIRPITGYTEEDVFIVGKNLIDLQGQYSSTISKNTSLLPAGEYYVYIFTEDNVSSYNSFVSYSTDGSTFTEINTTDDGVAVCDIKMQYSHKKCHITLHQNAYLRQGLQINANVSGKQIYVMITKDGTDYSSIANVPPYSEVANIWQPYKGKTYTTAFGQTVYGGTLDVLTGELTITHRMVDLGTLTWTIASTMTTGKYRFNASHTPLPKPTATNADIPDLISSNYIAISPSDTYRNVTGATIANNGSIYVYDEALATSTVADFKTAMNGVQLVYELETPTVIQLTPQKVKSLVGENHISASTGDVLECKYSMLINGDDLAQIIGG